MAETNSFLPEDYVDRRIEQRTNLICLILFLVMLGAIFGAYLVTNRQRTVIRRQQAQINEQFKNAAQRLSQLEELQHRTREMIRKARVTAELVETVPRTLILSELINIMPNRLSLLNFDLTTRTVNVARPRATTALDVHKKRRRPGGGGGAGRPPDEAPRRRSTVKVRLVGVAPTDVEVAQFMYAIGKCSLFENVNLSFSEQVRIKQKELRKFQIDMALSRAIDVDELQPKQVPRLKVNPMSTTAAEARPLAPLVTGATAAADGVR